MKDRINKLAKVHMERAVAAGAMLAALLIIAALLIVKANTPDPDIPLFPGSHYIDLARSQNESKPDLLVVMGTSEPDNIAVYEAYSKLLRQHSWGGGYNCRSGIPGTQMWHHSSQGAANPQGWAIEVEYRRVFADKTDRAGKTDIIVTAWRGSELPEGICGDLQ